MPPQKDDMFQSDLPEVSDMSSRTESASFYILLTTLVLTPLAFLPTPYIVVDSVKTVLIGVGVLLAVIFHLISSYRDRRLVALPRGVFWSGVAVAISLVVSALLSSHVGKSFFGQGFEINTASFLLVALLSGIVAFGAVYKKPERSIIMCIGITVPFLILTILHALRFTVGSSFLSLGVLSSLVSTLVGSWYDLASYAIVVLIIALSAIMFLPLSKRMSSVYWIVALVAFVSAYIINGSQVWFSAFVAFIIYAIYTASLKPKPSGNAVYSFIKRIAWLPTAIALLAGLMFWKGVPLASPVINKLGAEYTSLSLPWQLSIDVTSGSIKQSPLFGVGPNRFSQSYIDYKPSIINSTGAWNTEFNYAFGLLPTFIATQGMIGTIAWLVLVVFLCIYFIRIMRNISEDPYARFMFSSTAISAIFLWVFALFAVPSHTLVLYMFVTTGIAIAIGASYGTINTYSIPGSRSRLLSNIIIVLVAVSAIWTLYFIKDATALAYFGSGAKALSERNDTVLADKDFAMALRLKKSDVYLQARAETAIIQANEIASSITQDLDDTTSQERIGEVVDTVNRAMGYVQDAIAYDSENYYNYLSDARVSEFASNVRMESGYEHAVEAYTNAIRRNPLNPSIYVNLARLHISQNNLDEAIRAVGSALQVKNDYLDAVFLFSQIAAAQGNLTDAITAAKIATELNPQSPVLFFQLGLLQYNNRDYISAVDALETAIGIQADYANAQYFLGLSYVRLGKVADAIAQFSHLAETNPDNQEVSFILSNLIDGKSPFADAQPPVTSSPETRSTLPIDQP